MYVLPSNATSGSIYFSEYLDITKDIVVSFDYACYGTLPTGAEGFCVFFSDSFNPVVVGGGPGPGLSYAAVSGIDTSNISTDVNASGVTGGILGVGFDVSGNFGGNGFFNSGYTDTIPNSITLRGGFAGGNNIITRTQNLNTRSFDNTINLYQQIIPGQELTYNRVRVRVTDFGQRVIVDIKPVDALVFTNYLDFNLTDYNNMLMSIPTMSAYTVTWSSAVRCGLGFANGVTGDTGFKIKGFNINGVITTNYSTGTYTYIVDTKTLSATITYLSPEQNLVEYDVLSAFNYDPYGTLSNQIIRGQTIFADPSHPLVVVTPSAGPLGVPYSSGDNYVEITTTSI